MSKPRIRITPEGVLLALMALSMFGGLFALVFLKPSSAETRALLVIASSALMISGFGSLLFLVQFKKRLRRRKWLRAVSAWNEKSHTRPAPHSVLPGNLSQPELRQLAIWIFSQIGYRILNGEAKSNYIRLVNPEGGLELLACKQQPDELELHHVYSLQLEMKRVKARRGFFLAPAGFTSETIHWADRRAIFLADRDEISRLVAWANGKY